MLERVVPSQVVAGGEALRSLAGGGRWARLASPAPTPALHPTPPQTSVNHPSFCTKPPLTNSCRWRQVSRDSKKTEPEAGVKVCCITCHCEKSIIWGLCASNRRGMGDNGTMESSYPTRWQPPLWSLPAHSTSSRPGLIESRGSKGL